MGFLLDKKKSGKLVNDKKSKVTVNSDTDKNNFLPLIKVLLNEDIVHNFLRVNEFEGITYFNKERFEELLRWILLFKLTELPSLIGENHEGNRQKQVSSKVEKKLSKAEFDKEILRFSKINYEKFIELIDKAESSGYDFVKFQKELDKVADKKETNKSINKKRKKV
jgi:hypothetical protein